MQWKGGEREETQRDSTGSIKRGSHGEGPIECESDDDDHATSTRGFSPLSAAGYGICSSSQCGGGQHSSRDDDGYQDVAIEQRERHSTEASSGLHDGEPVTSKIPKLQESPEDSALRQNAKKVLLLDADGKCPYLSWHPEQKKLVISKTPALTLEETQQLLENIQKCLVDQRVTLRFHSLKKLDGDVLSCFLATYLDESETRNSSTLPSGSAAAKEQEHSVRVFCNADGASCYINSFCIGLTWLGLHVGAMVSERTATAFGAFLKTCVHPTLVPLDVQMGFEDLLGNWLNSARKGIQQDIHEFAEFFMRCLQPVAIDGTWWPKWSLSSGPATDQQMDDYARGEKDSILSLSLPNSSMIQCTLQELINLWHDELGMCNVFTRFTEGKILHVDRQKESVKDTRTISVADTITLPHATAYDTATQWIAYKVCAMTYHLGPTVLSGHYRTLLKKHPSEENGEWLDYEDSKLPDVIPEPTSFHLQNVTLIWLRFDKATVHHATASNAQDIL